MARLVRCARDAGDHYLYLRTLPMLAIAPEDATDWLLGYVRSLTALGLCGASRQVLERMRPSADMIPVVAELRRAIEGQPTGMAQWSSRRRRFEANVKALAQRCPASAECVRDAASSLDSRYELHLCRDGNAQVRHVGDCWPPRWVGRLDDHRSHVSKRVNTEPIGISCPGQAFDGVGLGWEILHVHRETDRIFLDSSASMYIVEPSPEAVALIFHLHDFRNVLADPRVHFFVGSQALQRLRELLDNDPHTPATDRVYALRHVGSQPVGQVLSLMHNVARARQQHAEDLRQQLDAMYAGRDAAWWADRFQSAVDENGQAIGSPLRILGLTSRHTTFLKYSMRDCLQALESLGHTTKLVMEPDDHLLLEPCASLQAQADFQPDVVLLLSRMRYEMPSMVHPAIPSVTWDQDALPWVFNETKKPTLAWNDFLMGFSAATAHQRFGWPKERLLPCAMAGAVKTYSKSDFAASELAPYRSDVSYVSHASASPEVEANHAEQWLPEGVLRDVFRMAVAEMLPSWMDGGAFPGDTIKCVHDCMRELSLDLPYAKWSKVVIAVGRVGDRAFRHLALNWVAHWAEQTGRSFRLWGRGWSDHLRLARFASGPTDNGEELRKVYRASTVNLQLMGYGFLHQRALDGYLASGFFMSRRAPADTCRPVIERLMNRLDELAVSDRSDFARISERDRDDIDGLLKPLGADSRAICPEILDGWRSDLTMHRAADIIPAFDDISFTGYEDFCTKIERFVDDEDTRRGQVESAKQMITDLYSYEQRMRQMISLVQNGFEGCGEGSSESRSLVPAQV